MIGKLSGLLAVLGPLQQPAGPAGRRRVLLVGVGLAADAVGAQLLDRRAAVAAVATEGVDRGFDDARAALLETLFGGLVAVAAGHG